MKLFNKSRIPRPQSCGLMLSYGCNAECKHCMYACSPRWGGTWISEQRLDQLLRKLSPYIEASPYGPDSISLNHGLHFSGGEPFLKYDLLLRGVELAASYSIPSVFAETNCFWCRDDEVTEKRLLELSAAGMKGLMISVNPFYLEYVPFEYTRRAIRIADEIFGPNLAVYQLEYYRRFAELGISGKMSYAEYLQIEPEGDFMRNVEFFLTGRPVYALRKTLEKYCPLYEPRQLVGERCVPEFIRGWHNHFDNYGNYVPGYCGGLSYGGWDELDSLVGSSPDPQRKPVLSMIMNSDFESLLGFAEERGWRALPGGYFSKCHLCVDIRKHLSSLGGFPELSPAEYYEHLDR